MGVLLSNKEVVSQSERVYAQFGKKWNDFSHFNFKLDHRNTEELKNIGIGKVLLMVAMGESTEALLPTIKENRHLFDLVTNDKCFGLLMDNGITPDYVMLCDANVPFKFFEPYIEKSKNVKLISTVYGNIEWTEKWKGDRYFYINRDSIQSELEFLKIFGNDTRMIPAGSNVSNAMVTFFNGADNRVNINWAGYERYLLVGFDYSWRPDGNYYAFLDPKPKRHYMNHRTLIDLYGHVAFTSENLLFSAKWLVSYVTSFKLPVVNCSERGILEIKRDTLKNQLSKINPDPLVRKRVRELFENAKKMNEAFNYANDLFNDSRGAIIWQ